MNDVPSSVLISRYPCDDGHAVQEKLLDNVIGPHFYFRLCKSAVKERFSQLMDHNNLITVFLFGSPHIDNYAKTESGCGMIDFDRAYYGPYAWDIACFFVSLSLRQLDAIAKPLSTKVTNAFESGYHFGLTLGQSNFISYAPLANKPQKPWQRDTSTYLSANKKWAKKLDEHLIDNDDPLIVELATQYLTNLDTKRDLSGYTIFHAGRVAGTMNREHNLIVLKKKGNHELLFVDIKPTRHYLSSKWSHNRWYYSPFQHDGQRMIAASKMLAPGITTGESYATVKETMYWGRNIPLQNKKIRGNLSAHEQAEFAYAVGTQLGRGHGLTVSPALLGDRFREEYSQITKSATLMATEIFQVWQYHQSMIKQSLDK